MTGGGLKLQPALRRKVLRKGLKATLPAAAVGSALLITYFIMSPCDGYHTEEGKYYSIQCGPRTCCASHCDNSFHDDCVKVRIFTNLLIGSIIAFGISIISGLAMYVYAKRRALQKLEAFGNSTNATQPLLYIDA